MVAKACGVEHRLFQLYFCYYNELYMDEVLYFKKVHGVTVFLVHLTVLSVFEN